MAPKPCLEAEREDDIEDWISTPLGLLRRGSATASPRTTTLH